jgi:hypothetical protein
MIIQHTGESSKGKILDALLYSLETKKKSIVILSSAWAKNGDMRDLKVMAEKHACYIIFVDYDDVSWQRKVVDRIIKNN